MTQRESEHPIAVIPARGGSKRVPGKNIRPLNGIPSIAYSINAAVKSGLFARVIVSTDREEIANLSRRYGAEVPFLRDAHLSDDLTPVSKVTVDVMEHLDPDARSYRHVAQLMPNCPLRTAEDIRASYRQFVSTSSNSQISVTRFGWQNPWWAMQQEPNFEIKPLFESLVTERSQDLTALVCPTGAIWWAKCDVLRREGTFHTSGRTGWEIPWQRGIDIDTEDDWLMAETLMRMSKNEAGAQVA